MSHFNSLGRRVPTADMRVFADKPSNYYKLAQPKIDYGDILQRTKKYSATNMQISGDVFSAKADTLLSLIEKNKDYANLLNSVRVPFVFQYDEREADLGTHLEDDLLPHVKSSFNEMFPDAHFKAVLQSNSELAGNIKLDPNSRYEQLISSSKKAPVVGWYFPQALQEFDIKSQRDQMLQLPELHGANVCLSGAMDICAALVGSPQLLISGDFYTPILCLSAYVHTDPRLVLLLKAYGPHLEFWCMSQMLYPNITQVSEQWSGGITIFY